MLHKENGGPAAARKYGIDNSDSDYLAFCDSDDYVEPDWLSTMHEHLVMYNADFVICGAYLNDIEIDKIYSKPYKTWVWSQSEAINKFIEHKHLNGILWTNLFHRSLFDGLEWKYELRVYEDAIIIWQMLAKIDKIVKILVPKYHYIYVSDSLTNRAYDFNRYYSTRIFLERVVGDCANRYEQYYDKALTFQYRWIANCLYAQICSQYKNREAESYMSTILRKGGYRRFKLLDSKSKIKVILMLISPSFARKVITIFKKLK